jgi:hypothetical protein
MTAWVQAAAVAVFRRSVTNRHLAAQNFHTISTDTHIDHLVIPLRGAHKNAARAVHFESLFDRGTRDETCGAEPQEPA